MISPSYLPGGDLSTPMNLRAMSMVIIELEVKGEESNQERYPYYVS